MSKNVFLVRKMLIDISLTNEAFSDKKIEALDLLIVNKYKNIIESLLFLIISYKCLEISPNVIVLVEFQVFTE